MKRLALVNLSLPTVAKRRPTEAAISALTVWPLPIVATSRTPSRARAAYSGGPKSSAQPATSGASRLSPTIETVAPTKEPIAATPSAVPALPCLASAKPSKTVTTERRLARELQEDGGDGAAVLRAVVDAGEHDDAARPGRR